MITVTNWASYQMVDLSEQPSEQPSAQPTLGADQGESTANWTANTTATIKEIKKKPYTHKSNSSELDALQPDQPKRKPRRADAAIDPVIREWFEQEFWPIYPRREGRQPALRVAAAKATTPERRAFFITRLKSQLPAYVQRKADSGQRVIPMASTWFNQDRADDELLPAAQPTRRFQAPSDDYPEYVPTSASR
jgi:hypothetical protein